MTKEHFIFVAKIVTDISDFDVITITNEGNYFKLIYEWGGCKNSFIIARRGSSIYFGHYNDEKKCLNQFGHETAIVFLQKEYKDLSQIIDSGINCN